MLNIQQFRTNIVRPALEAMGGHSAAAENLLIGTAVQESNLHYVRQLADGPARGFYQMEPATHDDIWDNYLAYRDDPRARVEALMVSGEDGVTQFVWNLAYATAMCRVHYMRVPSPLPGANDVDGLAEYWKQYYNTPLGQGTAAEFKDKFERFVINSGDAEM
jgi:hypothetical protein